MLPSSEIREADDDNLKPGKIFQWSTALCCHNWPIQSQFSMQSCDKLIIFNMLQHLWKCIFSTRDYAPSLVVKVKNIKVKKFLQKCSSGFSAWFSTTMNWSWSEDARRVYLKCDFFNVGVWVDMFIRQSNSRITYIGL